MKIKRLEIQGFKSFADKTVLSFGDGVTGVVGPNGCGKSNIVDAIRWVMGEQSAKHLRGTGMQDVIFAGSESRGPLGMAEVTVTFKNDGTLVPPEYQKYPEISVSRRLFRDGTATYAINKAPCRLRDVLDLFMGTGVGRQAYSIIEQGRIGLIVTAKPEDRRMLIEDAAGISRYKARRKIAERRIEATEQNLLRVQDIADELKQRLGNLERQAKKAERYKKIKEELRTLELHTAAHRYLEITSIERRDALACAALKAEILADEKAIASAEQSSARELEGLANREHDVRAKEAEAQERQQTLALTQRNLEFVERERQGLLQRTANAETEKKRHEEEQLKLGEEREAARAIGADLSSSTGEEARVLGDEERSHSDLRGKIEKMEREIESERQASVRALTAMAQQRNNFVNLERAALDLDTRIQRAEAYQRNSAKQTGDLEREAKEAQRILAENRQLRLALEDRRAAQEGLLERHKGEFMENEAALLSVREELVDKRSRLTSLHEIQKNYDGCMTGVRSIMMERVQNPDLSRSLHGLVADFVSADKRYETAVEAVLGERLQYVIVNNQSDGMASIDFLKRGASGRSSFIPLDLREDHVSWAPFEDDTLWPDLRAPGVCGKLVDLVSAHPGFEQVARVLLGDVVVVEEFAQAQQLWSENGHRKTFVTLSGDVLDPVGVLTGGSTEGVSSGMLSKKREIGELTDDVRMLDAKLRITEDRHTALKHRIGELEKAIKNLSRDSHQEELTIVKLERDLKRLEESAARQAEQGRVLAEEIDQLRERRAGIVAEADRSATATKEFEAQHAELEARVQSKTTAMLALRAEASASSARITELKVMVAAHTEKRASSTKNLARIAARILDVEASLRRLVEMIASGCTEADRLQGEIDRAKEETLALAATLEERRSELATKREELDREAQEIRERDVRTRQQRHDIDGLKDRLSQTTLSVRELQLSREALCQQIDERYRVALLGVIHEYHLMPIQDAEHANRIDTLHRQVDSFGPINLTAIEEFQTVSERYSFLSAQKEDLEQAIASLKSAIRRINATSKERYIEAFRLVNEKFQLVFPRLFNGGQASLVLTDESDPLESGIEMLAQPPGKKLQNVNLLSGGEKALTAIALIFGIFLIKPTPFCLLDEVDAPLDEANVGRYNEMIRDMRQISQFIIITHNKRTMEIPDRLYGVTMEEAGISRLVAVDVVGDEGRAVPLRVVA